MIYEKITEINTAVWFFFVSDNEKRISFSVKIEKYPEPEYESTLELWLT